MKEIIGNTKKLGGIYDIKNLMEQIRTKWKNRKIEIITGEIRNNIKLGDSWLVWVRINRLRETNKNLPIQLY